MGKTERFTRIKSVAKLTTMAVATVLACANICVASAKAADTTTKSFTNVEVGGKGDYNTSYNNYYTYGSTVGAYMYENADKTFTRVVKDYEANAIYVETVDSAFNLLSKKEVALELPIFGGFFSGKEYNFFVFGQNNPNDSDKRVVMRVVKYDKDFNRISMTSITGSNTYSPFSAGSLRMDEDKNGMLYVYTCHEMYQSSDGYHHQANMIYKIKQETMKVIDSYYGVMNISYGYVSHSFNQFIKVDGDTVYRVDHGDAYPRAVSLIKQTITSGITNCDYTYLLNIAGEVGDNYTGVSVGGLAVGNNNVLVVGNSISQAAGNTSDQREIFLSVSDKETLESKLIKLSTHKASDKISVFTPQIVRITGNRFLIMWEEYDNKNDSISTILYTVDETGKKITSSTTKAVRLTECQPIMCSDGLVRWFTCDGKNVTGYGINPYRTGTIFTDFQTPAYTKINSVTYSGDSMTVKYNKVAGATGYYVYRCIPGGKYEFAGGTLSATFVDTKASEYGQTYYYKVIAYKKKTDGTIVKGAASNFKGGKATMASPVITKGVAISKTSLTLTFKEIPGATGYYIYRSSGDGKYTFIGGCGKTTFTDTKLKSGTTYYYKIEAFKKVGTETFKTAKSVFKAVKTK